MQNYYSKKYVTALRVKAETSEHNFEAIRDKFKALELAHAALKKENGENFRLWQEEKDKRRQLERVKEDNGFMAMGEERKARDVKRTACNRAHNELHQVKAGEKDPFILQRAIGNAQGILAAAIDASEGGHADTIQLYPVEQEIIYGSGGKGRR